VGNDSPSGIAVRDDTLIVLDGGEARLYQYDQSGTLLDTSGRSGRPPGRLSGALWEASRSTTTSSGWSTGVRRSYCAIPSMASSGPNGSVAASQEIRLDPANARAEGLAIDDTYVYVLDQSDQRLYRYRRDGAAPAEPSKILRQADGNAVSAAYGVSLRGDALLVVDASEDAVASYDLTALFGGIGTILPTAEIALDPVDDDPRDIATVD
jgi:hypothetical protein